MSKKAVLSQLGFSLLVLLFCNNNALGEIQHLKIPSLALADSNRVIVATPIDFNIHKQGGYPFIVMLHGYSGDETQWETDADLQSLSDTYNVLLVLPDGGYDGWWVDTELIPGRNYGTHLYQEVTIWVVEKLNGSMNVSQHGILGLSMGGYGAIMQALVHPESYAASVSLSGVMDITLHADNWGLQKILGTYSTNKNQWESHNPMHLAQKPAPSQGPALLLICGTDDFTFSENQSIVHQMDRLNYSIKFQEEEGAHTHAFWKAHVSEAVDFIVSNMSKP